MLSPTPFVHNVLLIVHCTIYIDTEVHVKYLSKYEYCLALPLCISKLPLVEVGVRTSHTPMSAGQLCMA